ncbi:MAG: sulfotransferase [Sneathiella sp.]
MASHQEVIGSGETFSLGTSAAGLNKFRVDGEELLPKTENSLKEFRELVTDLGKELLDKMAAQASNAKRVIDKMPQNFLYIGHLHLMFPNAKIIHVKRNPVDTSVSNFCANFGSSLYYSNDLTSLGQYYVAYNGLMEHWKESLPDNILEIQYEDVVADLEKNARRMLEFIDLDWDERCLNFYQHTRSVNTANFDQVRQPTYKTSVGRHERYGDLLKPLLDELKPVLP